MNTIIKQHEYSFHYFIKEFYTPKDPDTSYTKANMHEISIAYGFHCRKNNIEMNYEKYMSLDYLVMNLIRNNKALIYWGKSTDISYSDPKTFSAINMYVDGLSLQKSPYS